MAYQLTELKKVQAALIYFKKLQREAGYKDSSNVLQDKWNMREIMDDINDDVFVKKLFRFYMAYSDDKSIKNFFYNYNDYKDALENYLEDKAARRHLAQKTVRK